MRDVTAISYRTTFSKGTGVETWIYRTTTTGPRLAGYYVNSPLIPS